MNTPVRWLDRWLAPWLAPRCQACSAATGGRELCAACAAELPRNHCACPRCALPLPQPAPACGHCLRRPPPHAAAFTPFVYADPVDRWLTALKFHDRLSAGRLLGELLAEAVPDTLLDGVDLLLPVPLHRRRLRERGYNQALELARPLAARQRLPMPHGLLRRERDTPHQLGLDAKTRRRNLRAAFVAEPAVRGRRVLLVDDVITTGSTLREAASTLRAAGATEVRIVAIARAAARNG